MQQLTIIEPIDLPDLRRADRMPSLPAWLISRANALEVNLQINSSGSFQDMVTLPAPMMLTSAHRQAILSHLDSLRSFLELTPERSQRAEAIMLVAVTKLTQALPGQKSNEAQVEAKGEAYMAALDDVPYWAVEAGIRKWYRGQCGTDESGRPFNYDWAPSPAAIRRVAKYEIGPYLDRIRELTRLVSAVEYVDSTVELANGRAAWRGLSKCIKEKVDLEGITFDAAVKIGLAEELIEKSAKGAA